MSYSDLIFDEKSLLENLAPTPLGRRPDAESRKKVTYSAYILEEKNHVLSHPGIVDRRPSTVTTGNLSGR